MGPPALAGLALVGWYTASSSSEVGSSAGDSKVSKERRMSGWGGEESSQDVLSTI